MFCRNSTFFKNVFFSSNDRKQAGFFFFFFRFVISEQNCGRKVFGSQIKKIKKGNRKQTKIAFRFYTNLTQKKFFKR